MQATMPIKICDRFRSLNDAASQRVTNGVPHLIDVLDHQTLTKDYSNRAVFRPFGSRALTSWRTT